MVIRPLAVLVALAFVAPAHADSLKLDEARKAIDEVRFDDAQRLLVGALADGGNSPAGVREIYKLSASTAVALGQREVGEQYYRRWIALDPSAAIGKDVAPKLREPFETAQAFIAAHGRLTATATRLTATDLDVVVSDPLAMAVSAVILGSSAVPLSTERRARLATADPAAVTVAILDDRGNRLIEVPGAAAPGAVVAGPVAPPQQPRAPRSRAWMGFAIPAGLFIVAGVGCGVLVARYNGETYEALDDSGSVYYTDIDDKQKKALTLTVVGGAALGVGVALAIPAIVLFKRAKAERQVVPVIGSDSVGAAIVGRF